MRLRNLWPGTTATLITVIAGLTCLRNGSPQRETLQLLEGLAASDEEDAELRKTAATVHSSLRKRATAR